jgi:hypothetical protein
VSIAAPTRDDRRARLHVVPAPESHSRLWAAAVATVLAVSALYHWLQSLGHVTPAVFTDELLFSELARSFASGDGFLVRGEHVFFPAFVPALLQAPAWLAGSTPDAYATAKTLNTLLMCSAALPAYWLARRFVQPLYAIVVATATVAGGAMLYHGYLTSEAVAYPVFLLAVAVCVRTIATPSLRWDLGALAVLGVAVATRAQFVVLPVAFGLTLVLAARPLRRHATALVGLALAAAVGVVAGASSLGFYEGATMLDYPLLETARWTGWTAALLPFAAGILVVPGALVGLALAALRPQRAEERAFAVLAGLLIVLMPLQAGLIASGEAHKPFERYVFYVLPLLFVAFCAFAGRGSRTLHAAAALPLAGLALIFPFGSLALTPFSYDSPTLSAVETIGRWTSQGDAAALMAAAGVAAALAAAALHRRTLVLGVASVVLAFVLGVAAYSGDRRMTSRTLESLSPAQTDWLERSGVPQADVLVLPGGSLHAGWVLESWNRNVGRTYHLGDLPVDPLPYREVGLEKGGLVSEVDRTRVDARYLVVNDYGSQAELIGRKLTTLPEGLSLYRVDGAVRLRWLAEGVYRDGWAQSRVVYSAFPTVRTGRYRVVLSLPKGRAPRRVDVGAGPIRRFAVLRPGRRLTIQIPVSGRPVPPLAIRIDRADFIDAGGTRPRLVAARLEAVDFASKGSRN